MNSFLYIHNKLQRIDFDEIIYDFFNDKTIQQNIINTIQGRIYLTGLDSNLDKLKTDFSQTGEYGAYAYKTEQIKKNKREFYRHVTLFDSGQFYKSFKIKAFKKFAEIKANFKKSNNLIDENFRGIKDFRNVVLSLSDEEMDSLVEFKLIPYMLKSIKNV